MVSRFTLEELGLHLVPPYCFHCSVRDWIRRPHVTDLSFFHSGSGFKNTYPDSLSNSAPDVREQGECLCNKKMNLQEPSFLISLQCVFWKHNCIAFDSCLKHHPEQRTFGKYFPDTSFVIITCLRDGLHVYALRIGLLQPAITSYKIRHAGGQTHYYPRTGTLKQRDLNKLDWPLF